VLRVTAALNAYEFGVASDALLEFVWYKYCDWYLEATKTATTSRAAVLSYVLNTAVRLLHPIAPFVTEEIWQALPHDGQTIVTASWPDAEEMPEYPEAAARYERLMVAVGRARDLRAELGLHPREKLTLEIPASLDSDARTLLALHANANLIERAASNGFAGEALDAVTVRAPREILIQRHRKDAERLDIEVARLEKKLGNEQFVGKASPDVVAKEREKLSGYVSERERARAALAELEATGEGA